MTRKEIIDGLQFTIDMFLFDPMTGETLDKPRNEDDRITIDACRGAIEALKAESFDMPTGCWTCQFMKAWDPETDKCTLNGMEFTDQLCLMHKRADGCPLEALKAEPCEDAVSREVIETYVREYGEKHNGCNWIDNSVLYKFLKNLPPVTPKPKTGKWIHSFYSEGEREIYKCSECGRWIEFNKYSDMLSSYPFCHCGAKMEGVSE